jgi:hypothetical protein
LPLFPRRDPGRIHLEHEDILEACRLRDQALSKERVKEHIYLTQRALDEQLRGADQTPRGVRNDPKRALASTAFDAPNRSGRVRVAL